MSFYMSFLGFYEGGKKKDFAMYNLCDLGDRSIGVMHEYVSFFL